MTAAEKERALRAPKALNALVAKSLESLTGPRKPCPSCGTPFQLIASKNRFEYDLTWTAIIAEDGSIAPPEHAIILELQRITLQITGRVNTQHVTLEPDEMHLDESGLSVLLALNHAQPGQPVQITARVSVPVIAVAIPRDRCCPTRARDLGTRLRATKGDTDDNKYMRACGRDLLGWAETQERKLLEESRREPDLGLEPQPARTQ